ncbi:zinc-binding alcohol dehydrogenase family protein [Paenibacillus sp. sptzw28]|uniref:zinc-binding alcohol dehydrogenase family protein n=1 Tax=Paenibacillus sp. sptzw28 TaxID=715179 RepID=UPI001C6E91B2|nr:zinc-binding alcohol dehydrogenase family protein [Paenibacillus sp. sptzw28]QYR20546.1 zinc-binding alcohol dehydrogenase family protein [Paenibacillus sp. sptzw28]
MTEQNTMKAVGLTRYLPIGHPESLVDINVDKPAAAGRDILVKVQAISVNPIDTKVRAPKDQTEQVPRILGWDVCGIVEQAGEDCTLFKSGDEVYYAGTINRPGGNSQYHVVDERIVGHKPKALDYAEAAALPLTGITAWEALHERLGIPTEQDANEGKAILIIGAAGGVGSIATQLASQAGLTVIGTASRSETAEWSRRHGSTYLINHYQPFMPQLMQFGLDSVQYILCLNATEQHWTHMAEVISPQGKICSIVDAKDPLNLNVLKSKSASFVWEFMFTKAMYKTADMIEQHHILNRIAELVDSGDIETTMTERLAPINAANLRLAHAKIEEGATIGKIVLENWD